MVKTLLSQVKEYKIPSILTPICMIGEVICEMVIPILMARIVDIGIYGNNMQYIFKTGGIMIVIAILGLVAGLGGAQHRDGSLEYYFSEPVVENEAKGVAPLILAYTEILRRSNK